MWTLSLFLYPSLTPTRPILTTFYVRYIRNAVNVIATSSEEKRAKIPNARNFTRPPSPADLYIRSCIIVVQSRIALLVVGVVDDVVGAISLSYSSFLLLLNYAYIFWRYSDNTQNTSVYTKWMDGTAHRHTHTRAALTHSLIRTRRAHNKFDGNEAHTHPPHMTRLSDYTNASTPPPSPPPTLSSTTTTTGEKKKNSRKEFRWIITFMHNKFSFINCSLNGVKIMNFRLILLCMIPFVSIRSILPRFAHFVDWRANVGHARARLDTHTSISSAPDISFSFPFPGWFFCGVRWILNRWWWWVLGCKVKCGICVSSGGRCQWSN